MTTDWWWWTLVFVAKGAVPMKTIHPLWTVESTSNYFIWNLVTWWGIGIYESNLVNRSDLSSSIYWTWRYMTYKLKENWPYYTQIYRERWLPSSLVGRESYAPPGFSKWTIFRYANITAPTNMNYLWNKKTQSQWWNWTMSWWTTDGDPYHWPTRITTPSWEKIYYYSCRWCITWYMMNPLWSWNWFFPDITYWY